MLEDEICCNKSLEYLQNMSALIANVIIINYALDNNSPCCHCESSKLSVHFHFRLLIVCTASVDFFFSAHVLENMRIEKTQAEQKLNDSIVRLRVGIKYTSLITVVTPTDRPNLVRKGS